MIKKISLIIIIIFYLLAGINHFVHPGSYYVLIPPYLPFHVIINVISGVCEIVFGAMLILPVTRRAGAYGIVGLLLLFIPAHIYMIQKGGCMSATLCVAVWVMWVRLLLLQPLLILWALWHKN